MSHDMQSHLASYYAGAFPAKQGVRVTALAHISEGWESDMYSFTVESGPAGARQREDLILRIYPGDDAHVKSAREYRGMSLLHKAGYPVPKVLVLEREGSPFGRPFVIMERIQGRQLWPLWFRSPEDKQKELLTLFCGLLVQLHSLEWRPFGYAQGQPLGQHVAPHNTRNPYALVDRELGRMRPYLERFPVAGFLPSVEWLMERRGSVPCEQPSVVHWDYHPANIILRDDGSAAVLDWTQVDVSDSRFDLAWTLLLVSTYEDAVWHGCILHEYERLAGAKVEQLAFFEVFACLKRLYSVAASLRYGPETLGMRRGAEAMMVQQMGATARVYDLLLDRTGLEVPEIEELLAQSS